MGIPVAPILTKKQPDIVGVFGPDGVLSTAVKPSEAAPPVAPPSPPPASAPSTALQPVASGEDVIQGRVGRALGPTGSGQFVPGTLEELSQARVGRFSTGFVSGFTDGLLGAIFSTGPKTVAERDAANFELANYASQNPWSAFLGQMAGGFVSDAPIELALVLGTGGLGNAMKTGASATGRGIKAFRVMARGVDNVQEAFKIGGKGAALNRVGLRGLYEVGIGGLSGAISETVQQEMGKPGNISDVLERAAFDALASGIFAEGLRFGAKGLRLTRGTQAKDMADLVADDVPGLSKAQAKEAVERAIIRQQEADTSTRASIERQAQAGKKDTRSRAQRKRDNAERAAAEELAARQVDSAPVRANKRTADPETVSILRRFNKSRTVKNLRAVVSRLLDPESKGRADDVLNVLARRAAAAGLSLEKWLDAKRLRFDPAKKPMQIVNEMNDIIAAPANSTSVADLFHEIGHLIFSDMDDSTRAAAKRILGVDPGDPLPTSAYEDFANQFRDFVNGDKTPSRGIRRMFEKVQKWLKNVYNGMTGRQKEDLQTLDDIFERLLDDTGEATDIPSIAKQEAELAVRVAGKQKRLLAEGEKKPKAPKKKEFAEGTPPAESAKRVRENAKKAQEGFETSTFLPTTTLGKVFNKVQQTLGRLAFYDNLSLVNSLKWFGEGFQNIADMIPGSVSRTASLYNKMVDTMNIKTESISHGRIAALSDSSDIKIQTAAGEKTLNLTGLQRLKLYLMSLDGFDANKSGKVSKNSAQRALIDEKGGFLDADGKVHVITKEQLKEIQKGSVLKEGEQEIADAILASYQSVVPEANKISQQFIGADIFDPTNRFYNPKNTTAKDGEGDIDVIFNALVSDASQLDELAKGNFRMREGSAPMELRNPIEELKAYQRRVSHVLGHLEFNRTAKSALEITAPRIKAVFGKDMLASMNDLVEVNSGNFDKLGIFADGKLLGRLFTLRQIGMLGLNPGVVMKQAGSSWSAAATGRVSASGLSMGKRAAVLFNSPQKLSAVKAEMELRNPTAKRRFSEGLQVIELEDSRAGLGEVQTLKGELSMGELKALVKERGIKLSDAATATLQKTTNWIRKADESTLASIWEAVKVDVDGIVVDGKTLKAGTDEFFAEVNKRFDMILLESQPTIDPTSRSLNQMKPGILAKALTQFSTQTRKNWELMTNAFQKFANIENKTRADWVELGDTVKPLMMQAAYITAVSVLAAKTNNLVADQFASERRQKRLEKARQGLASQIAGAAIGNTFGSAPITGPIMRDSMKAMFGSEPFGTDIPVLSEITDAQKAGATGSVRRFVTSAAQVVGLPTLIKRPIGELAGQAAE